jgi:quinolinate synthase
MAMNALQGVVDCLARGDGEIELPAAVREPARRCIERMLAFVAERPAATAAPAGGFVAHLGAA